jgi:hypothetical protein
MKFQLKQVASGKFRVMDGADTIGSISGEPEQVNELLRCWSGPTDCFAKPQQSQRQKSANPMIEAMLKAKSRFVNREAILRGC